MTREDIEKFSVAEPCCFGTDREERWYRIGCIDGLRAADIAPKLNILWHDANEEANARRAILTICGKFMGSQAMVFENRSRCRSWDGFVSEYKITMWAYVDDLLPKQFGNSEQLKGGE